MNNPVDPRARTARVDQGWRAVLYCLDSSERERTYVYAGTWEHDTAIHRAKTIKVNLNAVNGAVELIADTMPAESTVKPEYGAPAPAADLPKPPAAPPYLESQFNYSLADLVDVLGFDEASARRLLNATSETEVLATAEAFENAWQQTAALGSRSVTRSTRSATTSASTRRSSRCRARPRTTTSSARCSTPRRRCSSPSLRTTRSCAASSRAATSGPGECSCTRSSAVRDAQLQRTVPAHRRRRDRQDRRAAAPRAEPRAQEPRGIRRADDVQQGTRREPQARSRAARPRCTDRRGLGEPVCSCEVSTSWRARCGQGGRRLRGCRGRGLRRTHRAGIARSWALPTDGGRPSTTSPPTCRRRCSCRASSRVSTCTSSCRARITSQQDYFAVRRPGRGVALDRKKRAAVWEVVERYRKNARIAGSLSFRRGRGDLGGVARASTALTPACSPTTCSSTRRRT